METFRTWPGLENNKHYINNNKNDVCLLSRFSCVRLFATLWTVAHQTPLSMGFCRQEYWSELPFPSPGIFATQGLNMVS